MLHQGYLVVASLVALPVQEGEEQRGAAAGPTITLNHRNPVIPVGAAEAGKEMEGRPPTTLETRAFDAR